MSGAVKMNRRLYLTADANRVVEDGDPEAATLLCAAGGEVPHATAARYGLLAKAGAEPESKEPEAEEKSEPEKKAPTAANKAGRRPADKSRTPEGDK